MVRKVYDAWDILFYRKNILDKGNINIAYHWLMRYTTIKVGLHCFLAGNEVFFDKAAAK